VKVRGPADGRPDFLQLLLQAPPDTLPAVSETFRHRVRVRFAECDMQGIVFNAHYLTYFDVLITELWREAVGGWQQMVEQGSDLVVAEVRVRYLAPARFDDELELGAQVARLGNTAVTTRTTVERAADGVLVAEGELRHVCIDPKTGAKQPIPDPIREGLARYAADEAAVTPRA
jgi:acyl-CoA thioester hydrolase